MDNRVLSIVNESIVEVNSYKSPLVPELESPSLTTCLYGSGGALTSIDVVTLISEVEERVEDELDVCIALASERAMSMKSSPFRSVKTLVEFVEELIEHEQVAVKCVK